jgi:hypothetical protein
MNSFAAFSRPQGPHFHSESTSLCLFDAVFTSSEAAAHFVGKAFDILDVVNGF